MLVDIIKKVFFNNYCSLCGTKHIVDNYLCSTCISKLNTISNLKHRKNIYYIYCYSDIKNLIFDFKFKNRKNLAYTLSKYIKLAIEEIIEKEQIDVVIPVPASKQRMLTRGFNQVDELLTVSGIKFDTISRNKNTKHMFSIKSYEKRVFNISNAFSSDKDYSNKKILLVDDILTTGATLNELNNILLHKYNAKNVIFFSVCVVKKFFYLIR